MIHLACTVVIIIPNVNVNISARVHVRIPRLKVSDILKMPTSYQKAIIFDKCISEDLISFYYHCDKLQVKI